MLARYTCSHSANLAQVVGASQNHIECVHNDGGRRESTVMLDPRAVSLVNLLAGGGGNDTSDGMACEKSGAH
jgi:hypothetical protein